MDYNKFFINIQILLFYKLLTKFRFVKKWLLILNFKQKDSLNIFFYILLNISNLIILINGVCANVILFNILARLYNYKCVAFIAHIRLEKQDSTIRMFEKFMICICILFTYIYMIILDLLLMSLLRCKIFCI